MECPICESGDWKAASLVHREGLAFVATRTTGAGVSLTSSGPGIGAGAARTNGTQQSALSKAAAPPATFVGTSCLAFLILGGTLVGLAAGLSSQLGWISWAIVFFCGLLIVGVYKNESRSHQDLMQKYQKTRVCARCGARYTPEDRDDPSDDNGRKSDEVGRVDILLTEIGSNRMAIIKEIRDFTGLDLLGAKLFSENIPKVLKRNIAENLANEIKDRIERAGGFATIIPFESAGSSMDLPLPNISIADELEKLADLRNRNILTESEFQLQKAALLNR